VVAPAGQLTRSPQYIVEGIFFKFAIDAFGVYGGDEFAAKAAAHELNGLKAYYRCNVDGLYFPFMTLMDYRGFRLIATTRLPLSKNSLVYGSADGGATIKKEDPTLNVLMARAAKHIGIKEHVVGVRNQKETLAAPTDIEGHVGTDGRRYVLGT
jgi:hypothetical protein